MEDRFRLRLRSARPQRVQAGGAGKSAIRLDVPLVWKRLIAVPCMCARDASLARFPRRQECARRSPDKMKLGTAMSLLRLLISEITARRSALRQKRERSTRSRLTAAPGSAHAAFILQGIDDLPGLRADHSVNAQIGILLQLPDGRLSLGAEASVDAADIVTDCAHAALQTTEAGRSSLSSAPDGSGQLRRY